ncbi:TetR/AcrR family transcriptional regulator [Pseudomonas mucidolens]|uniref:Transcriptional regulator, TetR family n=1 Tax=Pseudomonas mucidolens TaxID=46679 RepID=A0A1H2MPQ6_9PSED|nr:TetR/AcrR family transcriptional regulator [Pseudomonas mucidolens]SDU95247.1 transcriptional regulator, TetR family [Pseudomonas mucidolens]SQH33450.1 TetR family transcriptional regulator [Pseudomonas mucidolens]
MTALDVKSARDRILEGACELFALHGFQAVSLRDLATYVGVKPGSLYHHIESKQSLLYELVEDAVSELLYRTRLNLRRKAQARDRLDCFIDTLLGFKQHSVNRTILLSREYINLAGEQAKEFSDLKSEYTQILSDIIKDLVKTGSSQPLMLSMATDAVIGMLFSQAHWLNAQVNVSGSQQGVVFKRFTYGIISTMSIEAPAQSRESGPKQCSSRK